MGLNLISIAGIEDKKGLKIRDSLSKKHFQEMKKLGVVQDIKSGIYFFIKEYGDVRKVISNCYYSEVTKYEIDYDNYVEFSVNRDYLSLMVIQTKDVVERVCLLPQAIFQTTITNIENNDAPQNLKP